MNALGALGVVVSNSVGPDPSTFAASVAYADSAGEPGAPVAYGEFFTLLDATQFVVTQSWVLAITREYEHLAATIVRGGPVDPGLHLLDAAGTPTEISDAVGELLMDQAGAR
jgi:hypothetical protein